MNIFHLDGKIVGELDKKISFTTLYLCFRYSLRHGRKVRCPHFKNNEYRKTNKQLGQTCLSSMDIDQVKLDHLENHLYIPD